MKNYNEVVLVKKKKSFVAIFIFSAVLVLTTIFSLVCSPLLGISYIGQVFGSNVSSSTYFFVALSCQSEKEAVLLAEEIKAKGGAGVVWKSEELLVIISAYKNKSDAQKIATSVKIQDTTLQVVELEILTNTKNFSESEKKTFETYLDFVFSVTDNLYDLASKIDTGETTKTKANLEIRNIYLEALNKFETLKTLEDNFNNLKTVFLSMINLLQIAGDEDALLSTTVPYQSEIRKCQSRMLIVLSEGLNT